MRFAGEDAYHGETPFVSGRAWHASDPVPHFEIQSTGRPMDFSSTAFGTFVVSDRMGAMFRDLAVGDVQLIKAAVENQKSPYYVANVTTIIDRVRTEPELIPAPGGGSITGRRNVFNDVDLEGVHIFRVGQAVEQAYVSSWLKDEILKRNLIGPALMAANGELFRPGFSPCEN